MSDIIDQINDIHREVGSRAVGGEEARTVLLRRTYDAAAEDVWDACTNPERIARWFLPVSGDLKLGGHYQLEGNAGGEILRCEPPKLLKVSWVMGESPGFSEVEVRLTPEGEEKTVFELEHTAAFPPEFWDRFGPGAVGVGWDLMALGLAMQRYGEELTEQHPFRERSWGQLIVALYRSGRQADALAAYQRVRATLVEHMGLEPNPELKRLERQVLQQLLEEVGRRRSRERAARTCSCETRSRATRSSFHSSTST